MNREHQGTKVHTWTKTCKGFPSGTHHQKNQGRTGVEYKPGETFDRTTYTSLSLEGTPIQTRVSK
jgi:hypothetical protein